MKKLFRTYAELDATLQSEGWLLESDNIDGTATYKRGGETLTTKRVNKYWMILPVTPAVYATPNAGILMDQLSDIDRKLSSLTGALITHGPAFTTAELLTLRSISLRLREKSATLVRNIGTTATAPATHLGRLEAQVRRYRQLQAEEPGYVDDRIEKLEAEIDDIKHQYQE